MSALSRVITIAASTVPFEAPVERHYFTGIVLLVLAVLAQNLVR